MSVVEVMKRGKTLKDGEKKKNKSQPNLDEVQLDPKKISKKINFRIEKLKNRTGLVCGAFENEQAIKEFDWKKNKKIARFLYFYMPYMKEKEVSKYKNGAVME